MMKLEPKSMCELELGPLTNLEPEGVLEPETVSGLGPVRLLVLKTVSGLELVLGMMLESMTTSELERALEGSLLPENVSEMEIIHQEQVLKLGLGSMSVWKPDLREVMQLGLVP